ncbi:ABC transporter substrate-binding protein [Micromonospora sp. HM5-17]|jgi:ABC-type glycerol-3-phosphate transport system substrate-binding protein|uniref:ABC transporter substrate-binding protein n=1 Tax=Micromonospora sp. HM5-17 TaxID=2487710 RepID=UPI000F47771F|nr:ABC transporter substrate-binding protein [Micromonospora sp. HM5-17]ROT28239.1 carbohydrate ABC transporter substrate-binding protein [Micromonospora sp. HM5-17]
MRKYGIAGMALVLSLALAGCGGDDGSSDGAITGEITVLTQRTDIVNTVFQDYKRRFEAKYPGTTVKFEAITDYEGEIRIRMNTKEYGDVLLIPNSVTADMLPTFFEPLGTVEELKDRYRFVRSEQSFEGTVYGLAITGNAQGFVYNKRVWQQAGITTPPKTPAEFLAALTAIRDRTDAIPLYTNYKDKWPLGQWEGLRGVVSGDPDAAIKLGRDDAPWAPGKEHYIIDSLLFDAVAQGLTEPDPTTTNWEQSKAMLGTGKIATMMLGSWAIVQMQEAAPNKADIGYLPFPLQVNGTFHSVISGDYKNAININSKNKATARAWIEWFANESNYAADQGGISPVVNQPMPATLADLTAAGTTFIELNPAPKGEEGLADKIGNEAEIALWDGAYRQRIVDAARGARNETKEQIFADLNRKWAETKARLQ